MLTRKGWTLLGAAVALLLAAIGAYLVLGGGPFSGHAKEQVLGLVVTPSEDSWTDDLMDSITQAAQREGYRPMPVRAERSQASQIEALRSLIAFQVDAIVFAPAVESGWDNVLLEAKRAGIPVICANKAARITRDSLSAGYVGYHYQEAAMALAELCLAAGNAPLVIVELHGEQGSSAFREVSRGFRETLASGGQEVKYRVNCDGLRSRAQEITAGIIQLNPGINTIFSHNDAMTLGAIDALTAAGLRPGTDVQIYTIGGSGEVQALLEDGKLNGVASRDTAPVGELVLQAVAARLAQGEEGEEPQPLYAPVRILSGEVAVR